MTGKYRHVIRAFYGTEWAILPAKLEQISELLELRAQGVTFTPDQIKERVGMFDTPTNRTQGQIAVLNLFGTISQRMNAMSQFSGGTSTEMFAAAFQDAVNDPNVSAIVINIDSPGGSVPGVPELADMIYQARGKKRIVSVVNPMMASAALWIGTAAGEVVAIPSASDVGSIGVLTIHTDQTKADAEAGLTRTIIKSNEFKAEGNPYEPLSDSAKTFIAQRIMKIHEEFVSAVAKFRGVTTAKVEADFGNGRTLRAKEALQVGLIDRIATLEEVLAELGASAGSQTGFVATSPQSFDKGKRRMNAKLKKALITAGLCKVTDDQAAFDAALSLHCEAEGLDVKNEGAILASFGLGDPIVTTSTTPASTTIVTQQATSPSMSMQDLTALIKMANIADSRKVELIGELSGSLATLSTAQVLDKISAENLKGVQTGGHAVSGGESQAEKFATDARDALLLRTWGSSDIPKEVLNYTTGEMVDFKPKRGNYGLQSLPKLAEQCLIHAGVPYAKVAALSPMQLAKIAMGHDPAQMGLGYLASDAAYNVSGMFSNILLDAANVTLRRSYNDARTTFQIWMKQGPSVADFKLVNRVIAGELGDPRAVPEDGEFEETTLTDGKESYRVTVWGEIISLSWQLIVNDQLGSFTEVPAKLGRAMRRKQNRIAYAAVKANALMADNTALFAAGRNNRTTGALSTAQNYVDAFAVMERKMADQVGLTAESGTLGYMPKYLVYPTALDQILRTTLNSSSVASSNSGTTNIYQGAYELVKEPELNAAQGGSDTRFILAADQNEVDTFEYAYLQGLEAPVIEQEMSFERLGMKRRIYQAFGVKPLDHRGLQDHTGA
jgi:capsid assembly protease